MKFPVWPFAHIGRLRLAYRRGIVKATWVQFSAGKMRGGKRDLTSIVLLQVIG
jgi:hypothetical protein